VTVDELLVLARALDVAPVNLLVPPRAGDDAPYEVAPGRVEQNGDVREWIRGYGVLTGGDSQLHAAEMPIEDFRIGFEADHLTRRRSLWDARLRHRQGDATDDR
jgi:hypothetical protein